MEFAEAAPAATTMCSRGSSAHMNGFYNDRAINLLNALVGSVDSIVETLQARRERWTSSYCVISEELTRDFAPVVARLAGS